MSMSVMHWGKRLCLQHLFVFMFLLLIFWGLLKSNDISRPTCICYFWKLVMCVCVSVCVCVAPAWGHVCTARCADPLQGFCGARNRWEMRKGSRQDALPALAHQQNHILTLTQTYTPLYEGENEQILLNIFCYSSTRKKKQHRTFAWAKYTIPQLFKSLSFPKMPVWHELKIREICSR